MRGISCARQPHATKNPIANRANLEIMLCRVSPEIVDVQPRHGSPRIGEGVQIHVGGWSEACPQSVAGLAAPWAALFRIIGSHGWPLCRLADAPGQPALYG